MTTFDQDPKMFTTKIDYSKPNQKLASYNKSDELNEFLKYIDD